MQPVKTTTEETPVYPQEMMGRVRRMLDLADAGRKRSQVRVLPPLPSLTLELGVFIRSE